jgi:hypothetical protein
VQHVSAVDPAHLQEHWTVCYSLWYNAPTMLPAGSLEVEAVPLPGYRPATSWAHYTTNCNTQSSAPEDGRDQRPKHVEVIGIINKPLLLHLVGVYIIYLRYGFSQLLSFHVLSRNIYRSTQAYRTVKRYSSLGPEPQFILKLVHILV